MGTSELSEGKVFVPGGLLLAMDTCGPTGSVALGRLAGRDLEVLGQRELEGRSYSATLVAAVSELLAEAGIALKDLGGMVAVNGPGSFTGVRVGLSAVKGLAEGAADSGGGDFAAAGAVAEVGRTVVRSGCASGRGVSAGGRAGVAAAGVAGGSGGAGGDRPAPLRVAVCDEAAAELLTTAWPETQLVWVRGAGGEGCAAGLARRDWWREELWTWRCWTGIICGGQMRRYLARPRRRGGHEHEGRGDGDSAHERGGCGPRLHDRAEPEHAPKWTKSAYLSALKPQATPRRIALVAEDASGGHGRLLLDWRAPDFVSEGEELLANARMESGKVVGFAIASLVPPQAELETIVVASAEQRRGIGRTLMAAMVEELGAAAVSEALLEVRASNEWALRFYRSLGWREQGRRLRYYIEPVEDAVLMSLAVG